MQRKVEFYSVKFTFVPMKSMGKSDVQLKDEFIKTLNSTIFHDDPYEISYNESNESKVVIEIVESDEDFIFGIISKVEDLKNGPLKRIKDKKSNEVLDSNLETFGFTLENYTYFYLCKESLYISVINNTSAPKFKRHFQSFLNEQMDISFIEKLEIHTVLDEKIDLKLNQVNKVSQLDMIFDDTSILGHQLLGLKDSFGISQNSLRRARISIDLKLLPITADTKGIFRKVKDLNNGFEKFELTGVNDQQDILYMELIDKILTKRVNINIDDKQLINTQAINEIKKALKGSLASI